MARKSRITKKIYVIDTSYLTELFHVPGYSEPAAVREIKKRVGKALVAEYLLVVPGPCLFQLADHINEDRENDTSRKKLCHEVLKSVRLSMKNNKPWMITPSGEKEFQEQILQAFEVFAQTYTDRNVDLTDSFIVEEARRLKNKYAGLNYLVHIWTRDRALKELEPDSEPDSFVR